MREVACKEAKIRPATDHLWITDPSRKQDNNKTLGRKKTSPVRNRISFPKIYLTSAIGKHWLWKSIQFNVSAFLLVNPAVGKFLHYLNVNDIKQTWYEFERFVRKSTLVGHLTK